MLIGLFLNETHVSGFPTQRYTSICHIVNVYFLKGDGLLEDQNISLCQNISSITHEPLTLTLLGRTEGILVLFLRSCITHE